MAEEIQKEVKRGYVKWTDADGVFHKELLSEHPELLADASPKEQLYAEEARRQSELAEDLVAQDEENAEELILDTVEALKAAPDEVVSAAQLPEEDKLPADSLDRDNPQLDGPAPASG